MSPLEKKKKKRIKRNKTLTNQRHALSVMSVHAAGVVPSLPPGPWTGTAADLCGPFPPSPDCAVKSTMSVCKFQTRSFVGFMRNVVKAKPNFYAFYLFGWMLETHSAYRSVCVK